MFECTRALSVVIGLGLAVAPAAAQLSTAFSYQGVLEDGGSPANGAFDIQFRLFTAELGGSQVGPVVTSLNQAVSDGLIQQQPDFGDFFVGQRLWIEVSVRPAGGGAYAALPRREILSTPNAQYAVRAAEATFAATSGTTLDEAIDNGADVDLGFDLISLTDGLGTMLLGVGDLFGNDALQLYGGDGNPAVYFARDSDGTAGFLSVASDPSFLNSIRLDGSFNGSGSPRLGIFGDSVASFDMSSSGPASVSLPVDAIESAEMFDEPGVASIWSSSFFRLTPTITTVFSRTITVPSDGFVVALGSFEAFVDHETGTDTAITMLLTTNPSGATPNYRTEIEASVATDLSLSRTIDLHNIFAVSAGSTTVYARASATGGGDSTDLADRRLTLMYFPTAYGSITPRLPGDAQNTGEAFVPAPAPRGDEIAIEQAESVAANFARMQAEMAAMKAQIEALRAETGQGTGR
ncbi:MAG: hypothetical protein AAGI53_00825 [Planctomycetota bacterium]